MKFSSMKAIKAISLLLVAATIGGCGGSGLSGELFGVQRRPRWEHVAPFGMVYIPSGTLFIGNSDQDVNFSLVQRSKSVSIAGFYMDDSEITNNEYRQFVYWIRDSIAHKILGNEHIFVDDFGNEKIDWSVRIEWDDPEIQDYLKEMYFVESDRFWGRKELDKSLLNYEYYWTDYREASRYANKGKPRSDFIKSKITNVYPDTLVWVRDFTYSYNEPMTRQYFWHPAFDHYPVVGVNWDQARSFSIWRTQLWSRFRRARNEVIADDFRIPYESEWEYASRGGKFHSPYPWGGPYLRNSKGCILANFKPGRGNYVDDGGFYTVMAYSYLPNDFGLYNMAGNVAEWTATTYDENTYAFMHDLNSDYRYNRTEDELENETLGRKVIRGGSWKDIAYFLQTGSRTFEYADTSKSYIGFRCSMGFLGRSINDNPQESTPRK